MAGEGPGSTREKRKLVAGKGGLGCGQGLAVPCLADLEPRKPAGLLLGGRQFPGGLEWPARCSKDHGLQKMVVRGRNGWICGGDQKSEARRPARLLR